MVSSFSSLMAVVNGRKELPQSVSNQWPHINTPLLPPQRGNYIALLPPSFMWLRHFACMCLREKGMKWGKSIHGLTTKPTGPLPIGLSVQEASSCYSFFFFFSIYLPLSLYPLHFFAFWSCNAFYWPNKLSKVNMFHDMVGFDRSRVDKGENLPAVSQAVAQPPDKSHFYWSRGTEYFPQT